MKSCLKRFLVYFAKLCMCHRKKICLPTHAGLQTSSATARSTPRIPLSHDSRSREKYKISKMYFLKFYIFSKLRKSVKLEKVWPRLPWILRAHRLWLGAGRECREMSWRHFAGIHFSNIETAMTTASQLTKSGAKSKDHPPLHGLLMEWSKKETSEWRKV